MVGRFEGLTDEQWLMLEPLFPPLPQRRGKGQPPADRRLVLNSILWILITGARWCDLPDGPAFAKRSTSHRWMVKWQDDGLLYRIEQSLLSMAELQGLIDWSASSVDGSFSPR